MTEIDLINDEEFDQCLGLIRRSVSDIASEYYSTQQIAAWLEQYPSPEMFATWRNRRTMLVAREGALLVGFGQIEIGRKEIVGVHVEPSKTRNGIGSRLIVALEKIGTESNLTELVVQSSLNAVAFYQHCGYESSRDIEFQLQNGVKLNALLMQKRLSTAC